MIVNNQRIKIWKAEIVDNFPFGNFKNPGIVVASLYDNSLIIKTRNGFIHTLEYTTL
jgi:methionyl-tRNA formyltransferase